MVEHMLTTVDNPFNPFTEWNEWSVFDTTKGYHTSAFLARISKISHDMSPTDQTLAIEQAIDEIIKENVSGMWRKVTQDDYAP